MFNQTILEKIEEEQLKLEKDIENKNEEVDLIDSFVNNNNLQNIYDIDKNELINLFIIYFRSICNDLDFNILKNIIYQNEYIFTQTQVIEFKTLYNSFLQIASSSYYDDIINKFEYNGLIKQLNFDFSDSNILKNLDVIASIVLICEYSYKNKSPLFKLVKLVHDYPESSKKSFNFLFSIMVKQDEIDRIKNIAELKNDFIKETKESKKNLKKIINSIEVPKNITDAVYLIRSYSQTILADERSKKNKSKKELNYYLQLKNWIDSNSNNDNILTLPAAILKISNLEIRKLILTHIYQNNLSLCKDALNKYEGLINNSINNYKKVLQKYNILVADDQINITVSVTDLEKILDNLKKINITDPNYLLKIVNITSLERVEEIINFINKGYLNVSFLEANVDIFDSSSENKKYQNLCNNIQTLIDAGLAATHINKMETILLDNHDLIDKNINIVEQYQLISTLKVTSAYDFISQDALAQKIDVVLELGCEDNLNEDLALLNYSLDDYKKIMVLNRLNIPLASTEEIIAILNHDKMKIMKQDMNEYLLDLSPHLELEENTLSVNEFIKYLETINISNSLRTYQFDQVIISKNKVLNELKRLNKPTISVHEQAETLLKNKIIDQTEARMICDILSNSNQNYQKRKSCKE